MPQVYISGDRIEEAREAIRNGTTALHVARQLGLTVEELNVLLGRPNWKHVPTQSERLDLWAGEDQL